MFYSVSVVLFGGGALKHVSFKKKKKSTAQETNSKLHTRLIIQNNSEENNLTKMQLFVLDAVMCGAFLNQAVKVTARGRMRTGFAEVWKCVDATVIH